MASAISLPVTEPKSLPPAPALAVATVLPSSFGGNLLCILLFHLNAVLLCVLPVFSSFMAWAVASTAILFQQKLRA